MVNDYKKMGKAPKTIRNFVNLVSAILKMAKAVYNILHYEPYNPVNANRFYKRLLEKECPDLPKYRLHDLRHIYFTWCAEIEF